MRENQTAREIVAEVWDVATGKKIKDIPVYQSSLESGPICQPKVDCPSSIGTFSPDGTQFITTNDSGTVTQWDVETGNKIRDYPGPTGTTRIPHFSPDGKWLSIAGTDSPIVGVWDAHSGEKLKEFSGHSLGAFSGRFRFDMKRLVTSSTDGTAILWDMETGQKMLTFTQGNAPLHDVFLSPDGKYLATAAFDRSIKLWDAVSGKEMFSLKGTVVLITPDSKHLITNDIDGVVRGYYLDINELMEKARSLLIRSWTLQECVTFLHTNTCPASP